MIFLLSNCLQVLNTFYVWLIKYYLCTISVYDNSAIGLSSVVYLFNMCKYCGYEVQMNMKIVDFERKSTFEMSTDEIAWKPKEDK